MKLCAKFSLFLVVAIAVMAITPVFAVDPAVRQAGLAHQAQTFSELLKRTEVDVTALSAVTPSDVTATGAAVVSYLPTTYELPILLRVQNLSADDIRYETYATVGTAGVTLPTASSPILTNKDGQITDSGEFPYEQVFYHTPTQVFAAASNTSSLVIEVWGRKGTE